MKHSTILLTALYITGSHAFASNPFDGIWCNLNAVAIYEQNGLGDNGSDLHRAEPESMCVEYKVIQEHENKLGGVGRYITVQKRSKNNAPHFKLHPTWNPANNQFTSVGLFSFMKNFDGSMTVQYQDSIDEHRHSLAIYNTNNHELSVMLNREPEQYDQTKARMALVTYRKQSDNIDPSFNQRWQEIYTSGQNHIQGKINP